jgi:hypothetical protein
MEDEDVVCLECGGVPEDEGARTNPERAKQLGWVEEEFGLVCPPDALRAKLTAEAAEADEVNSLLGQTDIVERMLIDGMFPDAPRALKESLFAKKAEQDQQALYEKQAIARLDEEE